MEKKKDLWNYKYCENCDKEVKVDYIECACPYTRSDETSIEPICLTCREIITEKDLEIEYPSTNQFIK